jgi:hypothetical protein
MMPANHNTAAQSIADIARTERAAVVWDVARSEEEILVVHGLAACLVAPLPLLFPGANYTLMGCAVFLGFMLPIWLLVRHLSQRPAFNARYIINSSPGRVGLIVGTCWLLFQFPITEVLIKAIGAPRGTITTPLIVSLLVFQACLSAFVWGARLSSIAAMCCTAAVCWTMLYASPRYLDLALSLAIGVTLLVVALTSRILSDREAVP